MKDLTMEPDSAVAVVQVTVEVRAAAWGADCTVEQAVRQATREATQKLQKLFDTESSIRVIGAKAVRVICNAKER